MAKKKSAKDQGHPGVYLFPRTYPNGTVSWRAKWIDPDSGATVWETLSVKDFPTEAARRRWAKIKSQEIRGRAASIEEGSPRRRDVLLADAVADYYRRKTPELRESTIRTYRWGTDLLLRWAAEQDVRSTLEISPVGLADLRVFLVRAPKRVPAAGSKRGVRRSTGKKRAPYTINRDLRTIRQVLTDWRRLGWLHPVVDSDTIRDQLKSVRNPRPVPTFLRAPELRRLLDAAFRHDAETHRLTREEHRGTRPPGTTPCYTPITPFLLTVLLTGFRRAEAEGLRWSEVYLEEKEIVLQPDRVKTHQGRRIDLSVSPALLALFREMKLRSGGEEYVFGGRLPLSTNVVKAAHRRLQVTYGAPRFTWQELRRTCGTYLTCAPSIYGGSSAFLSAKRLGHSVTVAEKHYVGAVTDIDPGAKTLEAAMGIEETLQRARIRKGNLEIGGMGRAERSSSVHPATDML